MKNYVKPYNVLIWDFNSDSLQPYDIMPYLINCWQKEGKGVEKNPESIKQFILNNSMYMFWARCEYEFIVTGWPVKKNEQKIDVYYQIKNNIDVIVEHFMQYI